MAQYGEHLTVAHHEELSDVAKRYMGLVATKSKAPGGTGNFGAGHRNELRTKGMYLVSGWLDLGTATHALFSTTSDFGGVHTSQYREDTITLFDADTEARPITINHITGWPDAEDNGFTININGNDIAASDELITATLDDILELQKWDNLTAVPVGHPAQRGYNLGD